MDGTSFSLKVIALILMTLDHIHAYIGTVADVPVIFGIHGRPRRCFSLP